MTVKVIIPTALRQHTGDEDELQLNARTVSDALKELVTAFPNLKRHLYSESGRLRNFINIYLNEEDIRYKEGESTALKDGDTLMIVPAVAGGAHASDNEEHEEKVSFSSSEFARYSRHLIMPEVGLQGQSKLKSASVLIIGAGGLGTPSSMYLAAAGVGRIGIVDFDTIEKSNLHRQVLYSEQDIGKGKADVARQRLLEINPNISVEVHKVKLDSSNALDILGAYDIILDGTDNFPTRYLVNDACVLLGKPNVYASIFRFEGQASVFYARENFPCYRCLYPEPPPPGLVPSCAEGGVLGVLPGIMGSIQAAEAIDLIIGKGTPLMGRLLLFDALDMKFKELKLRKNPDCKVCGPNATIKELIDYDAFCGVEEEVSPEMEISPRMLKEWTDNGKEVLMLDVREPFEYEIAHLSNARLIPLGQLAGRVNELDTASAIVVYCHTGQRSAQAVRFLNGLGFKKAKNLKGGIKAWGLEVDPSMQMY